MNRWRRISRRDTPASATSSARFHLSTEHCRQPKRRVYAFFCRRRAACTVEILFKRDRGDPAYAERSLLIAIDLAREHGSRSFGLRAAQSLAKVYQSSGRPADARAVLAPALEGFSPTPEMPEVAEAQALLAALVERKEVKAEEGRRDARSKLLSGYALATMMGKGFAAEETLPALLLRGREASRQRYERAIPRSLRRVSHEVYRRLDGGSDRFGSFTRNADLEEAKAAGSSWNITLASILFGQALLIQGRFAKSRAHLIGPQMSVIGARTWTSRESAPRTCEPTQGRFSH